MGGEELLNPVRQHSMPEEWKHYECEVCEDRETGGKFVVVGGEEEWKAHFRSRRHRQKERRIKKERDWELWREGQGGVTSGDGVGEGDTPVT